MTKTEKTILRECFDNCMDFYAAIGSAFGESYSRQDLQDATLIWNRWLLEYEKTGHYTF